MFWIRLNISVFIIVAFLHGTNQDTNSLLDESGATVSNLSFTNWHPESFSPTFRSVPGLTLIWPVNPDNRGALGNDYAHFNYVKKNEYHTGIDIGASEGTSVCAASSGNIMMIQENGGTIDDNASLPCHQPTMGESGNCWDHGYGNTVIIEHVLGDGTKIYSHYSHLASIEEDLKQACGPLNSKNRRVCSTPVFITAGCLDGKLGGVGGTCYGQADCTLPHLHFEVKDFPTLGTGGDDDGKFGYTPNHPDDYGYYDPVLNIHNVTDLMPPRRVRISINGLNLRVGPGGTGDTEYRVIRSLNAEEE